MRHSATPHPGRTGVNRERVETALRDLQERALARAMANGRVPRVCLYAEEQSLATVRSFAKAQGWRAGRCYTDDRPGSACAVRSGWGLVREQVGSGRADGVVVLTYCAVSAGFGEFSEQLAWFEAHLAFIAVVETGRL